MMHINKLLDVFEDMLTNRHVITKKRPRCKVCGFRIRGQFHTDGDHHKRAANHIKRTK